MTRTAKTGIASLDRISQKALRDFPVKLKSIGFRKRTTKEILDEFLKLGGKMPDRANGENVLQDQWIYVSQTGYDIIILTGLVRGNYSDKGSTWVIIRNNNLKRLWQVECYHVTLFSLLGKLFAYAHLAQNITNGKPFGFELSENKKNRTFHWVSKEKSYKMNFRLYLTSLSKEDKVIVIRSEYQRNYYWKGSKGVIKKRQREINSTWLK